MKFADADLIGWPLQITVGKRGLKEGNVEVKLRRTGDRRDVPLDSIVELLSEAPRAAAESPSGQGAFDAIFG